VARSDIRASHAWLMIKKHYLRPEIEAAATSLKQRGLAPMDTEFERGRLTALEDLMAWVDHASEDSAAD